jgi:hypothetical protein
MALLLPKDPAFRSQKLRTAARDQACVNCGAQDGTVVLAHLPMAGESGTGYKTHDWLGAHLCRRCHDIVDGPEGRDDIDLRHRVLVRTLKRLFAAGVLVVP